MGLVPFFVLFFHLLDSHMYVCVYTYNCKKTRGLALTNLMCLLNEILNMILYYKSIRAIIFFFNFLNFSLYKYY